ncbi:MAG: helix-turn-helix transcriptional regulator, partial [Candidatus Dormibacteraeota bacterium]|nr:helix-turn-helix transcriptional regulator [Candidatus Dormibacteraeota bacterium]
AAAGLSQPNTSRHLRILREAGIVSCTARGRQRLYELQPERLIEVDRWLVPYRQLWRSGLDALERHLDNEHHVDDEHPPDERS